MKNAILKHTANQDLAFWFKKIQHPYTCVFSVHVLRYLSQMIHGQNSSPLGYLTKMATLLSHTSFPTCCALLYVAAKFSQYIVKCCLFSYNPT